MTDMQETRLSKIIELMNSPFMDVFNPSFDTIVMVGMDEVVEAYDNLIRRTPGFQDVPGGSIQALAQRLAYAVDGFIQFGEQYGSESIDPLDAYAARMAGMLPNANADDDTAVMGANLPPLDVGTRSEAFGPDFIEPQITPSDY